MPPRSREDELRIVAAPDERGVTMEQLTSVVRRTADAGGELAFWGVLCEDVYETRFGDGYYLHLRGAALDESGAQALASLGGVSQMTRWHVRPYRLTLANGAPRLMAALGREEEFSINDVIGILSEIAPGAAISKLLVGSGAEGRRTGPNLLSV